MNIAHDIADVYSETGWPLEAEHHACGLIAEARSLGLDATEHARQRMEALEAWFAEDVLSPESEDTLLREQEGAALVALGLVS